MHRAEHLYVVDGVEAEAARYVFCDEFFYRGEHLVVEAALVFFVGQAVRCDLRLDEVEVGERAVLGLERQLAAVDAVGVGDYAARAALAEYFVEHDDRADAGVYYVL